jgi:hypothetical protein
LFAAHILKRMSHTTDDIEKMKNTWTSFGPAMWQTEGPFNEDGERIIIDHWYAEAHTEYGHVYWLAAKSKEHATVMAKIFDFQNKWGRFNLTDEWKMVRKSYGSLAFQHENGEYDMMDEEDRENYHRVRGF